MPVCFPQFGQLGPLGQHGFARNSAFTLAEEAADSVTLVGVLGCGVWGEGFGAFHRHISCAHSAWAAAAAQQANRCGQLVFPFCFLLAALQVLRATGSEDAKYPQPFDLRVRVQLDNNSLTQELAVINTGQVRSGTQQLLNKTCKLFEGANSPQNTAQLATYTYIQFCAVLHL